MGLVYLQTTIHFNQADHAYAFLSWLYLVSWWIVQIVNGQNLFQFRTSQKVTFLLSDRAGCDVNRCANNKIYQPIITTLCSCCHQWRHINEEPLDTVTESS